MKALSTPKKFALTFAALTGYIGIRHFNDSLKNSDQRDAEKRANFATYIFKSEAARKSVKSDVLIAEYDREHNTNYSVGEPSPLK